MVLKEPTPPATPARPGLKIAIGLLVAFAALRVGGLDLLFDPIGWWLCLLGVGDLKPGSKAGWLALGMAVLSVVALFEGDAAQGTSYSAFWLGYAAGALVTLWAVVDVAIRYIRPSGDHYDVTLLDALRWAVVGAGAVALLAESGYAWLGEVAVIAMYCALALLVVILWRLRA
ncbi:hypothetical protein [Nonomuraea sp. NPDC049504]|uniref:hypothetical protein n=1 Tax=Nonomuraea sp. NPDC049504 TaxID=3154729 RepID=UPI003423F159